MSDGKPLSAQDKLLMGMIADSLANKSTQKTHEEPQKFRVHGFQVYRVSYDIEAGSAELAEKVVRDNSDELSPSAIEITEEWLPESTVDPLLANGEVDYGNVKNIDVRSSMDLRREALGLLKMAQALDGLQPYVVMHDHEYGVSSYIGWGGDDLTPDEATSILDAQFEYDKGETVVVDDGITLEEMTGVSPSSQIPSGIEEAQEIGANKKSCVRANCDDGQKHEGKIMEVMDNYVVQSVGRDAVIHLRAALSEVPTKDSLVTVSYFAGRGNVVGKAKAIETER